MTACSSMPPPMPAALVPPAPSGSRLACPRSTVRRAGVLRERREAAEFVNAIRGFLRLDPLYGAEE